MSFSNKTGMQEEFFKAQINVRITNNNRVLATVEYTNMAQTPLFLLKDNPNPFVNLDGVEIRYIGIMIKRTAYTIKDYEIVQPKATVSRSIDITEDFDFHKDKRQYTISVGAGYNDPISGDYHDRGWATDTFWYESQ
tara:strand:+ start:808 stop:1218 length:411 start_codon:yes stop_codon:yes gene_type:complete